MRRDRAGRPLGRSRSRLLKPRESNTPRILVGGGRPAHPAITTGRLDTAQKSAGKGWTFGACRVSYAPWRKMTRKQLVDYLCTPRRLSIAAIRRSKPLHNRRSAMRKRRRTKRPGALYGAVRDQVQYDPYIDFLNPAEFRASGVLARRQGLLRRQVWRCFNARRCAYHRRHPGAFRLRRRAQPAHLEAAAGAGRR